MSAPRGLHTATLLKNGMVLIAGGFTDGTSASNVATAELFDPVTSQFTQIAPMTSPRGGHSATLLPSGQVFLFGGGSDVQKTAELFDPVSATFQVISRPSGGSRRYHSATLLPSGKILLAGGQADQGMTNSAEVFDPATLTFTATSNMTAKRSLHTASLLPDGKVLLTGGANDQFFPLRTVEIYDPITNTFSPVPVEMALPRYGHSATVTSTSNCVVLAGGTGFSSEGTNAVELFDPMTSTLHLLQPETLRGYRYGHTATAIGGDKLLLAGGIATNTSVNGTLATAEVIDLETASAAPRPMITSFTFSMNSGFVSVRGKGVPKYFVHVQRSLSPVADFQTTGAAYTDADGVFVWTQALPGTFDKPQFFRAIVP